MQILFLHNNAPGQFRHLASYLSREGHEVVFLGQRLCALGAPIRSLMYAPPRSVAYQTHRYLHRAEACVRRGQQAARACLQLAGEGFRPDLVIGHPGWGEMMFIREVFPRAAVLSYCEMFYRVNGQDTGYLPETVIDLDGRCRIRTWNADLLLNLELMDRGFAPTLWQRDQHPDVFHHKIDVIHDGIDTEEVQPDPAARFIIPGVCSFAAGDEVVTFVARDLEPIRGFTLLMRSLPTLLRLRPNAHVVICGGDGISYGRPPAGGGTWRETMMRETSPDPARVHFVGKLSRAVYLDLLRVSALHLYLTVPFVLSWSCVEALAAGCLLLGSDVAPVREVIEDGVNGTLVDARDSESLARRAAELLASREKLTLMRRTARTRAVERFNLADCLAAQMRLVRNLAA